MGNRSTQNSRQCSYNIELQGTGSLELSDKGITIRPMWLQMHCTGCRVPFEEGRELEDRSVKIQTTAKDLILMRIMEILKI